MQFNFLWLNIRNPFFKVMLKISFRQNHMAICMCNENDKHDVEQKIAKDFYSLSGSRCQNDILYLILFAVGMTCSSGNRLSKTELLFRFIIYCYMYKLGLNFN